METIYIKEPLAINKYTSEPCLMAMGFFDGVHLGHRELLETAKKIAIEKELRFAVMTFFPHPSNVLKKKSKIDKYLSPLYEKKQILRELGVEKLYIVTFSLDFAQLSPIEFAKRYVNGLNCKHVVAGFDFTYGHKGEGNMKRIKSDGGGRFDVTVVSKKAYRQNKISSTKIRELLADGETMEIPHYLGEFYSIYGQAVREKHDIRKNRSVVTVSVKDYLLPAPGTYLVHLMKGRDTYEGVCVLPKYTSEEHQFDVTLDEYVEFPGIVQLKWISELKALSQMGSSDVNLILT